MKVRILLTMTALLLFSKVHLGQCPVNTISTNPDNYQNSSDPNGELKWDWQVQQWTGYRPGTPTPVAYQIVSPFYDNNGNPNLTDIALTSVKNYRPEDGWEFVARNFGTPIQGNDNPWFILYNRYNGVLRLFLQINSSFSNIQAAQLVVSFTNGFKTSGMFSQNGINTIPLNKFRGKAAANIPNKFVNSGQGSNLFFWLYGDIPVVYDPCTCNNYSRLNIQAYLFNNWEVKLDINGTLQTQGILITNGNSTVNNSSSGFVLDKLLGSTDNVLNGVKKFTDIHEKLAEFDSKVPGELKPEKDPVPSKFLDYVLGLTNAVNATRSVMSFASFFWSIFDKKPSGQSSTKTRTTLTAESKLKATATGTIQITNSYGNDYISNPGSNQSNPTLPAKLKPAYNNVLGVFNILERPKIEKVTYHSYTSYQNEQIWNDWDCIYNGNCQPSLTDMSVPIAQYKLSGTLKYVLNPASGLKINDIKVGLIFPISRMHIPTAVGDLTPTTDYGNIPAWDALTEQKLNKLGYNLVLRKTANTLEGALVSTQFVPVTCLDKLSFYIGGAGIDLEDSIGLRIFLEMEPINPNPGSNVDKVVQIYTYYYPNRSEEDLGDHGYFYDNVWWDDINYDGQPDWNTIQAGPWGFIFTGDNSIPYGAKWENTFSGIPTNLKLENQIVEQDVHALRDLEIGTNVTFGSNPITLYVFGNFVNNSGAPLPSNVTVVNSVGDPCGLLTPTPTDPAQFCNSTEYNNLSMPLRNVPNTLTSKKSSVKPNFTTFSVSPNPANNFINLNFDLTIAAKVKIDIFDGLGKEAVSQFINEKAYVAGKYSVKLSTEILKTGTYFVRLTANNYFEVKKITILK